MKMQTHSSDATDVLRLTRAGQRLQTFYADDRRSTQTQTFQTSPQTHIMEVANVLRRRQTFRADADVFRRHARHSEHQIPKSQIKALQYTHQNMLNACVISLFAQACAFHNTLKCLDRYLCRMLQLQPFGCSLLVLIFLCCSWILMFTAQRFASAVLATAIPSVCPSVCLSFSHTPVLCQNDGT